MCAAQQDIDQIQEAEMEAKKDLEAAEKRAKKIRESAEKDAKEILETAEKEAQMAAQRLLDGLQDKRMEIEQQTQNETDKTIKSLEKNARGKVDAAVKSAVKTITGEE
jgi:vacuolar-type H+-ATPase subunit H